MPTLILTGYPCSGKTKFANLLKQRALTHKSNAIQHVVIINEETACPDKTKAACYETSTAEKITRAALKTEFDKYCNLSSNAPSIQVQNEKGIDSGGDTRCKGKTLLILDSMNYIKGFRYELYCIAKSTGEKHGIIWLLCNPAVAKRWNEMRRLEAQKEFENFHVVSSGGDSENGLIGNGKGSDYFYSGQQVEELIQRYEPPDQRNRWDQPLYTVDVDSTFEIDSIDRIGITAEATMDQSVYNMHSLRESFRDSTQVSQNSSKRTGSGASSTFRRAQAVTTPLTTQSDPTSVSTTKSSTDLSTCNQLKQSVVKMEDIIDGILDSFIMDVEPLKQGMSTRSETAASANVLHDVDSICHQIIGLFLQAQKTSTNAIGSGGGKIFVPLPDGKTYGIQCKRVMQPIEMRQFMRQYIKWSSIHPPNDTSLVGISIAFLCYIESQL